MEPGPCSLPMPYQRGPRRRKRHNPGPLDATAKAFYNSSTHGSRSTLPIRERHNMEHAMSRYLSFVSAVLAGLLLLGSAAAAVDTLTITAEQAIVRVKPGITHPILAMVPHGAIFPVLETQEEWHKILLEDGREGWITRGVGRVEPAGGKSTAVAPSVAAGPVAQNRWALVIGNGAYEVEVGPLQNPVNDATDMATTLQQLGFEVTLLLNATRPQMDEAIAAFHHRLRPGGV